MSLSMTENSVSNRPIGWLNLVLASDQNYLPHLATTISSAVVSTRADLATIFVLSVEITESDLLPLRASLMELGFSRLELVSVRPDLIERFHVSGHVSQAAYLRFFAPEVLPGSIDYVLYLDCDTIVVDQLAELKGIADVLLESNNHSEPLLAAAWRESNSPHLRDYGFTSNDYFNSGVMLLNLVAARREKLAMTLSQIADEHHGRLLWWDQDVLNLALEDRWIPLPTKFNMTADSSLVDYAIVHFSGKFKPWQFGCENPEQSRYREFRTLTPYVPFHRQGLARYLRHRYWHPMWKPMKKMLRKILRRARRLLVAVANSLLTTGRQN